MKYKICTSITTTNFEQAKDFVQNNDMVELRLDLMSMKDTQIENLLKLNSNTIITFRQSIFSKSERLETLKQVLKYGVAYIDIEIESDIDYREELIQHAREHGTKIIISYHNFEKTPNNKELKRIITLCNEMGADLVKIVTTAQKESDNNNILSLYKTENNLIAFTMGEKGRISRLACLFMGAPFTYASANSGNESASGQFTTMEIEKMLDLIALKEMIFFAVCGNPILHSLSPAIFNSAYSDIMDKYSYFRIAAQSTDEIFKLIKSLGLKGVNITAPFKKEVFSFSNIKSEEVTILEAANTLLIEDDKIKAYNTDVQGVVNAIKSEGIIINNKKCIILGAGGAGCAAAYGLKKEGANVLIINRTIEKAKIFAEKIGCEYGGLDILKEQLSKYDILINTISFDANIIDENFLSSDLVILDAIYNNSKLKIIAENKGCKYIGGEQWLLNQAIDAYSIFTGKNPNIDSMKKAISYPIEKPFHISIIGFMGSGKSSVAPIIAKKLNIRLIDTDYEFENREKQTISEIIKNNGESYFREQEHKLILELLEEKTPTILSCGGGVTAHPESCKALKERSIVIFLYASAEECLKRIDINSCPMLAGHSNPLQAAKDIFESRKASFLSTAWILVNTEGRTIEQITEIIYEEINKAFPC